MGRVLLGQAALQLGLALLLGTGPLLLPTARERERLLEHSSPYLMSLLTQGLSLLTRLQCASTLACLWFSNFWPVAFCPELILSPRSRQACPERRKRMRGKEGQVPQDKSLETLPEGAGLALGKPKATWS